MTDSTVATEADVVTKLSPRSAADTAAKLTGIIDAKGMRLFALIDQREEAQQAGLDLRETILAGNLAGIHALTDALVAP